jgi:phosphatidylethanolamine-binding protein (PEBP) family uncharacterized protein
MLEKLPESVGRALQGQRSGIENIVLRQLLQVREVARLVIRSSAFENLGAIPLQFTADGDGISPPLEWHGVPAAASCVALIVEDADSPTPHPLVHAIAIAAGGDGSWASGALNGADRDAVAEQGVHAQGRIEMGLNSYLQRNWLPPDPPPGHGPHRYAFQLFALDQTPPFSRAPGRQQLVDEILQRALAAGCLVGTYERLRRQRITETDAAVVPQGDAEAMAPA